MKIRYLFPILLFIPQFGFCQPRPGDVFREYVWLPDMVAERAKFLRVGGRLDYKISAEHFPQDQHEDGHILIPDEMDLEYAVKAEVVLELVQSHEDTKGLAIQINDREWLPVPDLETLPRPQSDYMLHTFPVVPIPLDHLRAGEGNTFKLKVDPEQRWGWPQNIFYGLTFRIYYDSKRKPHLKAAISGIENGDRLKEANTLKLEFRGAVPPAQVDYIGHYSDFNWEGDGQYTRWHYHYHRGEIRNHIGSVNTVPFGVTWNTEWLPDQPKGIAIAARVVQEDGLIYLTEAVENLRLQRDYSVELCRPYHQPKNWVTRSDTFHARFAVHGNLAEAESLQAAWRSWSPCYSTGIFINDQKVFDKEDPCYDYAEHLITIDDPEMLRPGENTITSGMTPLYDGKMVHGMEMQYPGVMVKVKYRVKETEGIRITEGTYEGAEHFIITTPSATYYYDKAGGGLSRMIDRDGNDWIDFKREPWDQYPPSAASAYRGIPNFVFGGDDSGAGHPGHDRCESTQAGPNTVLTTSKSNEWQWRWTFYDDHASVTMERSDPDHPYWFLYEGTPGGKYDPPDQYYGTDRGGPHGTQLDYYKGNKAFEHWQWAYFGHRSTDRALFIVHQEQDKHSDTFSYLGNSEKGIASEDGMVVFGFGRADGAKPLMTGANTFFLGFWEQQVEDQRGHKQIGEYCRKIMNR